MLVALQVSVATRMEALIGERDDGDEDGGAGITALLGGLGADALNTLVEKVCAKVQTACEPLLQDAALALGVYR